MKHASRIAAMVVGCAAALADFCPNYPFGPGLFLDIWAANCNSPGTGVYLSSVNDGIENVAFGGGNIDIIAQPGNSGEPALIQVQAFQSGTSIGNITVFSADAVDVSIVFSPSIGNVGSVKIHPAPGNVVRRLSLAGQIAGDMGEVEATGIANLGAVLSLEIQGDLTGHVMLFDNGLSDELRIRSLTVNGDIAPNLTIDAESGGIGTIEVRGVIGAPSNPVLIRSGRDITKITAGAMYANILAKWDDPNDPNAPTVYANIHELRTQFDTQNGEGPVHSGVFDGSILANSIGQPIERGFEIGTPGISQIEIQGDLAAVLTFYAPVVPDQTFDGPQIVVGGDFLATSIIQLSENGLVGQIILNRDDEDGIWQTTLPNGAKINVGDPNGPGPAYSLTGPSYGFTATSLGGGAAGHAAFRVHRQSSIPPLSQFFPVDHFAYGELRLDEGGLGWECVFDAPIIVQFYGPVGINSPEVPAM